MCPGHVYRHVAPFALKECSGPPIAQTLPKPRVVELCGQAGNPLSVGCVHRYGVVAPCADPVKAPVAALNSRSDVPNRMFDGIFDGMCNNYIDHTYIGKRERGAQSAACGCQYC